eukprot:10244000-Lingulodinium_polyedra.AAC.1
MCVVHRPRTWTFVSDAIAATASDPPASQSFTLGHPVAKDVRGSDRSQRPCVFVPCQQYCK